MRNFSLLFLILVFQMASTGDLFSQSGSIGSWRDHLPYSSGKSVAVSDDKVYCGTEHSVFVYDKEYSSISFLNTITGLSDVGISVIRYHEPSKTLLIAYENSNIDLVTQSHRVINMSDIYRKQLTGQKTINEITFSGNLAYLSCGFGIVVLDMDRREVKNTYIIGDNATNLKVRDIAINDTAIFAATENGIYQAIDYKNKNLLDYRSWQKDTTLIHPDKNYSNIELFHNNIFIVQDNSGHATDTIFYYNSAKWDYFDTTQIKTLEKIRAFGDDLLVVSRGDIDFYNSSLNHYRRIYDYGNSHPDARDAYMDENGWVWIADHSKGLVFSEREWMHEIITPEGPRFISSVSIEYGDDRMWVATGGVDVSWNNLYNIFGLAAYGEEGWESYYYDNTAGFDTLFDIMDVAVNPADGDHVFAGSWGSGLIEMNNGQVVNVYDETNSLLGSRPQYSFVGVAGLIYDDNRNLWMTNSFTPNGLLMLTPDKKWKSFDLRPAVSSIELGDLVIDEYGQKWIILPRNGGLLVFSDNGTYDNQGDDQVKRLSNSVGSGNLPSREVKTVAVDLDGEVWIGTDKGVAVFYAPGNVFSGQNYDAQQIFIPRNDGTNTGTFLLENETVTKILVDGANRKWIGTSKAGVFLMSADGTEEIHHFTQENSPLLSNNITSLGMNEKTGELFIGTDKGILSYRTEATSGGETHSDVYAFPNPVPPNFNGKIAIKGLVTDANVKITDISGKLIYQTVARGGQAIWNGKNFNGDKAHSGVYLVFSSNEDGEETFVAKILFLR